MKEQNTIYVDALSSYSIRPLADLVKEAYSGQVPFFHYDIGKYLKSWHTAKTGDRVIYCIDQMAVCQGDITFIKKKVFRPVWAPDNQIYNVFVDFARTMCHPSFDRAWQNRMLQHHSTAIKHNKWLFTVFAVIQPTITYSSNRDLLLQKVKAMDDADKMESVGICSLSD